MLPTPALFERMESMSVRYRERHWALIPPDLARRVRPRVERFGGGLATVLGKSDSLHVNRVVGFGHRGGATRAMVDELIAFYRESKVPRFTVELGPGRQTGLIERWLKRRGFTRHRGYSMLMRDARLPVGRVPRSVRIVRARRADLDRVVDVFAEVFGGPKSRRPWQLAVARAGYAQYFLALVGEEIAGVGALAVEGELGWLVGGATLPKWRHLGAHAGLIATRIRRARSLGCRWVWTETTEPTPGRPGGSRRNMLRNGFDEVFRKPIYLWRRA